MDLAVWWTQRRWRALLELIDELPQASRLWEARLNDPEEADLLLTSIERSEDEGAAPAKDAHMIQLREFDRQTMQLEDLKELIVNLTNTVRSALNARPIKHKRLQAQTLLPALTWERDVESASAIIEMAGFDPEDMLGGDDISDGDGDTAM